MPYSFAREGAELVLAARTVPDLEQVRGDSSDLSSGVVIQSVWPLFILSHTGGCSLPQ
jgi:hypothetical protein